MWRIISSGSTLTYSRRLPLYRGTYRYTSTLCISILKLSRQANVEDGFADLLKYFKWWLSPSLCAKLIQLMIIYVLNLFGGYPFIETPWFLLTKSCPISIVRDSTPPPSFSMNLPVWPRVTHCSDSSNENSCVQSLKYHEWCRVLLCKLRELDYALRYGRGTCQLCFNAYSLHKN